MSPVPIDNMTRWAPVVTDPSCIAFLCKIFPLSDPHCTFPKLLKKSYDFKIGFGEHSLSQYVSDKLFLEKPPLSDMLITKHQTRAPSDHAASIKDLGFTRPGLFETVPAWQR